jgi:hypothetical protein
MASDDDLARKTPSIPPWQQPSAPLPGPNMAEGTPNVSTDANQVDSLDQARAFLRNTDVQNETRDRKIAFLEKKGLQPDDIQKLLSEDANAPHATKQDGLKTVHDSNTPPEKTPSASVDSSRTSSAVSSSIPSPQNVAVVAPRSDAPPIITYPEFLLKPQKPPPLVTLERLTTAAYCLAGISALTWGASKYLVNPMLESLTSARHDLQSNALERLGDLNTKLESSVSHVPYITPVHQRHLHKDDGMQSDTSSDSDPTELYHRDIATQTSPPVQSRRSSVTSLNSRNKNATTSQTERLRSLHANLSSLLSSTTATLATTNLSTSLTDLQSIIDRVESNSQPLYNDYDWRSPSGSASNAFSSGSTNSNSVNRTKTGGATDAQSEAAKFKAEIRALKGAFLSSRNFPTARPTMAGAMGSNSAAIQRS